MGTCKCVSGVLLACGCKTAGQGPKKLKTERALNGNSHVKNRTPSFYRSVGVENGFAYLMEDRATEEVEVESSTMSSPPECAGMELYCWLETEH
jgi:hypothetical protein